MKTAVSIPDDVFAKAEALAQRKKVSRSELYVTALREYLQRHDQSRLTEEVNRVIDEIGVDAFRPDPAYLAHLAARLPKEDW